MGLKRLLAGWRRASRDRVPLLAAGVAFYGFLSIFPAIIATVMLYGLAASPTTVAKQSARLADALPADAASLLTGQLNAIAADTAGSLGIGLAVALLAALWSASAGVSHLLTALAVVFGGQQTRSFLRRRPLALIVTLAGIALVVLEITLIAVAPVVFDSVDALHRWRWLLEIARWALLLAVLVGTLTALYRLAAGRQHRISSSTVLAATAIWALASLGFSLYADNFGSYTKTYGALAGVVALLLWLWISAYAVLFGAELEMAES